MYSDFVFLDRFLFELSCKNTHTHGHTHTHTHTQRDSNEYPIVAFSKNATIITTTTVRPFKNSICEKTLKYLVLVWPSLDQTLIKSTKGLFVCKMYKFCQVVLRRKFLKVW